MVCALEAFQKRKNKTLGTQAPSGGFMHDKLQACILRLLSTCLVWLQYYVGDEEVTEGKKQAGVACLG